MLELLVANKDISRFNVQEGDLPGTFYVTRAGVNRIIYPWAAIQIAMPIPPEENIWLVEAIKNGRRDKIHVKTKTIPLYDPKLSDVTGLKFLLEESELKGLATELVLKNEIDRLTKEMQHLGFTITISKINSITGNTIEYYLYGTKPTEPADGDYFWTNRKIIYLKGKEPAVYPNFGRSAPQFLQPLGRTL